MPMRLFISPVQAKEIEAKRKKNKDKNIDRRLKVLLMHANGKGRTEISQQTGYSVTHISKIVAKYVDHGMSSVASNNYKGNRRNMSVEGESILLEKFKEKAEAGQIVEVSEIKKAYEEAIGRSLESSRGQIYRVLERHNWRKVMPRSKHPNKASDEDIEASKKLTLR